MPTPLDGPIWRDTALGLSLDLLDAVPAPVLAGAESDFVEVFRGMEAIEAGAVGNPDEGRRVGHYWLRAPERAPDGLGEAIRAARTLSREVAAQAHRDGFRHLLVLGIGGSALGPQLVADALAGPSDAMDVRFLDNTDPEGFARALSGRVQPDTLVVCTSKSGGTAETRNALLATRAAWAAAGLDFARAAVAVSGEGSALWREAEGWRARLPMWDWVGGRTSLASAVGVLPMDLQGVDADAFLAGAAAMDERTRVPRVGDNPAAWLAVAWHHLGEGRGRRAMVVLPYRDRLVLLSRYLQQLVMESLGKERDLAGRVVHQGLTVFGNKGSTDQHAYVQQLRDGPDDHFVTFLGVQEDGVPDPVEVEPGVRSGDYLQGFLLGTRRALREAGHPSLVLTLDRLDAARLGAVVALFERAVGLYALRVGINAYHQPGVEAGKKAAGTVLVAAERLRGVLGAEPRTTEQLAADAGVDPVEAWYLLGRLAANGRGVACLPGPRPSLDRFRREPPR